MYPDIKMIKPGGQQSGFGKENQSGDPQNKKAECIHRIGRVFEESLPDKWQVAIGFIKMIDSKGPFKSEVPANRIKQITGQYGKYN